MSDIKESLRNFSSVYASKGRREFDVGFLIFREDLLDGEKTQIENFWGCTRLADMLPSKYEDNTLQIKEKSTGRTAPFLYSKLPPVLPPIFWAFSPTPLFCSTAKSVWSSAIIWPWLPMRFSRALSSWTKAISADGVKANVVAVQQGKWLSLAF